MKFAKSLTLAITAVAVAGCCTPVERASSYQPPAPAPEPAPAPAPLAEPTELLDLVFFPHDSYAITQEGNETLDKVVGIIRDQNITLIRLEGHTDTTGTSDYNMRLSQRRAESVRDDMIARGVPPTNVYITAKGETDLRVQTADNVRNQSNRYVQIFVRYD